MTPKEDNNDKKGRGSARMANSEDTLTDEATESSEVYSDEDPGTSTSATFGDSSMNNTTNVIRFSEFRPEGVPANWVPLYQSVYAQQYAEIQHEFFTNPERVLLARNQHGHRDVPRDIGTGLTNEIHIGWYPPEYPRATHEGRFYQNVVDPDWVDPQFLIEQGVLEQDQKDIPAPSPDLAKLKEGPSRNKNKKHAVHTRIYELVTPLDKALLMDHVVLCKAVIAKCPQERAGAVVLYNKIADKAYGQTGGKAEGKTGGRSFFDIISRADRAIRGGTTKNSGSHEGRQATLARKKAVEGGKNGKEKERKETKRNEQKLKTRKKDGGQTSEEAAKQDSADEEKAEKSKNKNRKRGGDDNPPGPPTNRRKRGGGSGGFGRAPKASATGAVH